MDDLKIQFNGHIKCIVQMNIKIVERHKNSSNEHKNCSNGQKNSLNGHKKQFKNLDLSSNWTKKIQNKKIVQMKKKQHKIFNSLLKSTNVFVIKSTKFFVFLHAVQKMLKY